MKELKRSDYSLNGTVGGDNRVLRIIDAYKNSSRSRKCPEVGFLEFIVEKATRDPYFTNFATSGLFSKNVASCYVGIFDSEKARENLDIDEVTSKALFEKYLETENLKFDFPGIGGFGLSKPIDGYGIISDISILDAIVGTADEIAPDSVLRQKIRNELIDEISMYQTLNKLPTGVITSSNTLDWKNELGVGIDYALSSNFAVENISGESLSQAIARRNLK